MAIINSSNKYKFTARGPLDAKSLVDTFDDLISLDTWQITNSSGAKVTIAYNGMLVAVWRDTKTTNNGIYYLYDSKITNTFSAPNVTKAENWHKLAEVEDLVDKLNALDARLAALEEKESDVRTYGYRSGFPEIGETNKLYVAVDESTTYIWSNDKYISVGGSSGGVQPDIIFGGNSKI